jgi:pSer/pThr/pTyr-binding forkhead associated (FHA) protein
MSPKLIEPGSGTERTREIAIGNEEFLIGRGTDCDLRLREEDISRHHCLIHVRQKEMTLSDLGSSNGTFVNGQPVHSQARLKSGDEIQLGEKVRFVVDLGDVPGGVLKPEIDPQSLTRKLNKRKK